MNFYTYCGNNPVNCSDPSGFLGSLLYANMQGMNLQDAQAIGSFGNQVAVAGATVAASGPLAGMAATAAANSGVTVNGLALSNGLISGTSSALGSLALGGDTQSALISGGTGFVAGYISSVWGTPSYLANVGKGVVLNAAANFAAQEIGIGIDPMADYNLGSTVGSGVGGAIGNALIAPFGSGSVPQQLAGAVIKFGPSLTAKAIGGALGEDDSSLTDSNFNSAAANGGFVLYPNMSNTNQMQSVYGK